jgi:DNA-binding transcriptional MerR regulator
MSEKIFQIPSHLENRWFFAKEAGSFSGVKFRTVQEWTKRGLLTPAVADTTGTGIRRKYDVINCIEIAIIDTVVRFGFSLKIIDNIMFFLRLGEERNNLLWLLGMKHSFLVMKTDRVYRGFMFFLGSKSKEEELPTKASFFFDEPDKETLDDEAYFIERSEFYEASFYDSVFSINLTRIKDLILAEIA